MQAPSLLAPCSGRLLTSSHHPSPLIQSQWLGHTTCIDVSGNQVFAPADAVISYISPAGNFIHLNTDALGRILLCLGAHEPANKLTALHRHVGSGDEVTRGTPLLSLNQALIRRQANAYNLMAVILQPNYSFDKLTLRESGAVTALESELVIQKDI